jgi:hypothetical protein
MAILTSRTQASGVTLDDLIHIVITGDTSQNPAGSSYKASISQVFDSLSAYCVTDFYVTNVHGCSPITIWDEVQSNGSSSTGTLSFGFGFGVISSGNYSHAEGGVTQSYGDYSHSEGYGSVSNGLYSHSEGTGTISEGEGSHAEGDVTISSGRGSHSEGYLTTSIGDWSHAEGYGSQSFGYFSHAEGENTQSIGDYSHSEGTSTISEGIFSHTEGSSTQTRLPNSYQSTGVTNGVLTLDLGYSGTFNPGDYLVIYHILFSQAYYQVVTASTAGPPVVIYLNTNLNVSNTVYVYNLNQTNNGDKNIPGNVSHAEGILTKAVFGSHAEGEETISVGLGSHAEGELTISFGSKSHAEGYNTKSVGDYSHSEGDSTISYGNHSHSEGYLTTSVSDGSHAEGRETISNGEYSHTEGYGTISNGDYQHVIGKFNLTGETDEGTFIIGNGTNGTNRSNLLVAKNSEVTITGQLGIGTSSINTSSALQIDSTTQGFLPPRMSATDAESITAVEGLMVYITGGTGTYITSKGWWGYTGNTFTDWAKIGP